MKTKQIPSENDDNFKDENSQPVSDVRVCISESICFRLCGKNFNSKKA